MPMWEEDRVGRHNAVRDVFHNIARDSCSLAPVKEKPGLLPPRAPNDGDPPLLPDPPNPSGRDLCRPADVWVLHGPSGEPEAWDISICSALCASMWSRADWDSGAVFQHFESGRLLFRPLVSEAVGGGWSGGLGFLFLLARPGNLVAPPPSPPPTPSLSFAQRTSATLLPSLLLLLALLPFSPFLPFFPLSPFPCSPSSSLPLVLPVCPFSPCGCCSVRILCGEGLFHVLEVHFRSCDDEFYIGAHLRLAEAPSCPPARLWALSFPLVSWRVILALRFHVFLLYYVFLCATNVVCFTFGTFCPPSRPLLCLCPSFPRSPCWSHFLVARTATFGRSQCVAATIIPPEGLLDDAWQATVPDGMVAWTQLAASGDAPGARSWPSFWRVHSRLLACRRGQFCACDLRQ